MAQIERLKEILEAALLTSSQPLSIEDLKKLFVDKDQALLLLIPGFIILAFASKGISLYLARVVMIGVAHDVEAIIKYDMSKTLIKADSDYIDDKHSGKFISNITFDTSLITDLVSTVI